MSCLPDSLLAQLVEGELVVGDRSDLHAHLDRCASCRELVAALVRDPNVPSSQRLAGTLIDDEIALTVDHARYDVLGVLGAGGMGVVYEAYDHQRDAIVALKTLPAMTPEGLVALKAEFRAVADLRHPGVVRLHDLVQHDTRGFFTMERVQGEPLDRALAPLPAADGARMRALFADLARALDVLHGVGVVHRDVKPSNVLVSANDEVTLVDFGLAVRWHGTPDDTSATPRRVAGTLAFMAPEQVRGEPLGPAADWYAFGSCLYHALSGVLPFDTADTRDMVRRKSQGVRPPSLELSAHASTRDLADLCHALLHGEPNERPSGEQVLAVLGRSVDARRHECFVGRASELARLDDALRENRATVVVGPPGIGKTTTVRRALDTRSATLVLSSRCRRHEHIPFNALDGVVDALGPHLRHPSRDELGTLVALFPALGAFTPARAPVGVSESWLRQHAFDELGRCLAELARSRRVALFIDDLQWADNDSCALLGHLLAAADRSWSIAATARTDGNGAVQVPPALLAMLDVVPLGPLSRDEAQDVLSSYDQGTSAIIDAAAGHPLMLQRLARSRHARVRNLDEVLADQVAQLDPIARRIFDLTTLALTPLTGGVLAAAGDLATAPTDTALASLLDGGLLRVEPPRQEPRYEPYHDRIRDIGLALASPDRALDHLHLARTMLRNTPRGAALFACADHANAAIKVAMGDDAVGFGELNARAARQAHNATAHATSATYAQMGQRWLARTPRIDDELVRELQLMETESLALGGDRHKSRRRFDAITQDMPAEEQLPFWEQRVRLELVLGGANDALQAGRQALAASGDTLTVPVSMLELARAVAVTQLGMRLRWRLLLQEKRVAAPVARVRMRLYGDTSASRGVYGRRAPYRVARAALSRGYPAVRPRA